MYFLPIDQMWKRVGTARDDSDTAWAIELLNLGELLTKTVVAGMVAAVDDVDRAQYRHVYSLVRASGLGDWKDTLTGSHGLPGLLSDGGSQYVVADAQPEKIELTQRCGDNTWQHNAVKGLHECLTLCDPNCEPLPTKVAAWQWIDIFVRLRNKTRGHGAVPSNTYSQMCNPLERSIREFTFNFSLLKRPWAYLHRNVSGKYRISKLTSECAPFSLINTTTDPGDEVVYNDGIYVYFGQPRRVELIQSTADCLDFYYANGSPKSKSFEVLSYITGERQEVDIAPFLTPPLELPPSETQGLGTLELQGECHTNIAPMPHRYITRKALEDKVHEALEHDNFPVVTLRGRGGIGKTSLALSVLHNLAHEHRFPIILWFSARDIDLRPEGPKPVKANVQTIQDVAREVVKLLKPTGVRANSSDAIAYLASALTKSPYDDMPVLFAFDNFETVQRPQDLYQYIIQYIRLPNKALITTRSGDFTGDFAIDVGGMAEDECNQLIDEAIKQLGIEIAVPSEYRHKLISESEGHPYVIKVLLGEVKKSGHTQDVARIMGSREGILNALFERIYAKLPVDTQRVFLTLSNWHSEVPQLAVEAVLLRPQNEQRMNVDQAVEQLWQSSFIERNWPEGAETPSLMVPLVAAIFGKRKLAVSPFRNAVEMDTELLRYLGATQRPDTPNGISLRIARMFQQLARRISSGQNTLNDYLPIMEFIARSYTPAWLLLADVYEEEGTVASLDRAKDAIKHYLEEPASTHAQQQAWRRLATLCRRTSDTFEEIHALGELCQVDGVPFWDMSDAVHRLNSFRFDTDAKRHIARQVASAMASQVDNNENDISATDCSRLAWLFLNLHDEDNAGRYTTKGLDRDKDNEYCKNLARKLGI